MTAEQAAWSAGLLPAGVEFAENVEGVLGLLCRQPGGLLTFVQFLDLGFCRGFGLAVGGEVSIRRRPSSLKAMR